MTDERPQDQRLRVPLTGLRAGVIELPVDAARYTTRVHRLHTGDSFVAFDPVQAVEADAELLKPSPVGEGPVKRRRSALASGVWARLGEPRACAVRPARSVTLVQALGKGMKVAAIIRDATELGVSAIVPVVAERSVKRPQRPAEQVERWRRVAVDAARQCGRGDVPVLADIAPLSDILTHFGAASEALCLCLHPDAREPLRQALTELKPTEAVVVVVGPEGGLAPTELDQAARSGFRIVRFGRLVLRTETVCAAILGALAALADPDLSEPEES